ncbi:MAG: hypothetical protein P0Y49_21920 [Candidatus Pedobacter colombiensis]|uniref:Uncharacterized protein n=1 Tax=Candidatus Pedobacter colombiensis TaxID=3121371 RepID=A0AAJ5W992_9SPHI|nr:hypothetical protein [Pedobacter sp.]WEK19435.1 MAG: hypothetical protein P0Y49_21920 [Pedobacter sp.]
MNNTIYQPFKNFDFKYKNCFLSGDIFTSPIEEINVLPAWLLKVANFSGEEQIKLLDESVRSYNTLKVPCSTEVFTQFIQPLEDKIANAFAKGYAGVSQLDEVDLFKWIGKFMYSLIYIEMNAAVRLQQLSDDGVNMSQGLMHKFGNLNTMIQRIYREVVFENFTPWSIVVVPLEDKDTPFSFRDEINTLTFSLKLKDFGIIACLQDNGTNKKYHQELLDQIGNAPLSAPQFEELCARFYYSAYLFNRLPEYAVMPVEGAIYMDAMPLRGTLNKPLFDHWQHKTYAQVLQDFWKPWGHTLFEIIKDPTKPMSYFDPASLPETH